MRLQKIKDLLDNASKAYYDGEENLLSDEQYDRLSEVYKYETLGVKPTGNTARHLYHMYSLKKYFEGEGNEPEVYQDHRASNVQVVKTLKLDGAAIALYYMYGVFSHALTRGDGEIGQVIPKEKIATIANIPPLDKAWCDFPLIQVTGEVVVPKTIPNGRNYVSGALALKDSTEVREQMYFYAYGVSPRPMKLYTSDLYFLEDHGFATVLEQSLNQKFNTDGHVLRYNDNAKYDLLGYTNHHPRGALAVKVRKDGVFTKLLDVVWQVGKSGRITPVAILEPVDIDGATVKKATLNNPGFIKAMNLRIGDTVEVIRSGDIIPTIVGKLDDC